MLYRCLSYSLDFDYLCTKPVNDRLVRSDGNSIGCKNFVDRNLYILRRHIAALPSDKY